jgi:sn-glycerol 3-phosphate transport system ATP-binding protein
VGKPIELYDRPASLFVAGFIGSPPMNLIAVDALAALPGVTLPASLPDNSDIVGIRPDRVASGRQAGGIVLSGKVELIEPVGGESHLYVKVGGLDAILIVVLQGRPEVSEADTLDFTLPYNALHPFNKDSGRRTD